MRAVELLGARDVAALRVRLLPVRPEQVIVRPFPVLVARLWPKWVGAVAAPWGVYVRPQVLEGDSDRLAGVLCHELVHVRQWRTLGVIGFLWSYVGDYLSGRRRGLSHREAYLTIGLEEEARRVEGG